MKKVFTVFLLLILSVSIYSTNVLYASSEVLASANQGVSLDLSETESVIIGFTLPDSPYNTITDNSLSLEGNEGVFKFRVYWSIKRAKPYTVKISGIPLTSESDTTSKISWTATLTTDNSKSFTSGGPAHELSKKQDTAFKINNGESTFDLKTESLNEKKALNDYKAMIKLEVIPS